MVDFFCTGMGAMCAERRKSPRRIQMGGTWDELDNDHGRNPWLRCLRRSALLRMLYSGKSGHHQRWYPAKGAVIRPYAFKSCTKLEQLSLPCNGAGPDAITMSFPPADSAGMLSLVGDPEGYPCFASCLSGSSFKQFLQSLTLDGRFNHRVFKA